jgi:AraC-like DNA-binding protein
LAQKCNRSLTAFKKEFKKRFNEPPHQWCIHQRLAHARLLLVSSGKSVNQIGNECNFPNTSHFIKLFKKEYGTTPVAYRNAHEKVSV